MKNFLSGHFQSDPLEQRFGWYRQLSGANFFISIKQVLESERRIRVVSILKQSSTSISGLATLKSCSLPKENISEFVCTPYVDSVNLHQDSWDWDDGDLNALYFVAGYIAHNLSTKCTDCSPMIKEGISMPELELDPGSCFFNIVNRGGLSRPTDRLFSLVCVTFRVYSQIKDHFELFQKLILYPLSTSLFVSVCQRLVLNSAEYCHLIKGQCAKGHEFLNISKHVFTSMFHIFSKNHVRNFCEPKSSVTKIAKLQSVSTKL